MSDRPRLPVWRNVEGAAGNALTGVRAALAGVLDKDHLFGNHVKVTFPSAGVSVKVTTGLTGPMHGYRVERADADVRVFDGTSPTGITVNDGECWLQASAAATVTIYIY